MPVHPHKYNTRFQASLRYKLYDLMDKIRDMTNYYAPEPEPVDALNAFIEYYTFLQHFQCWRNDDTPSNSKDDLLQEIAAYKEWYSSDDGDLILHHTNWRDKKESVQLWHVMDTLEQMMKE
jgi:hypothetical protein